MARQRLLLCVLAIIGGLAACTPETDKAGQPCRWYGTCDGLACVAVPDTDPEDLGALPLECAEPSEGASPGDACEAGSDCATGICLLAGACADACDPKFGCAKDERCALAYARTSTEALQVLNACVGRVRLPADGAFAVATEEGALEGRANDVALRFDAMLPETDGATLFVLEHTDDDRWPTDTACRAPLCAEKLAIPGKPERVLFDIDAPSDGAAPINPIASDLHVYPVSVLVPNGTAAVKSAEGYVLRLDNALEGGLRTTQLQRTGGGERLDLNVFYVGAKGFEVMGARGTPLLADALDEVDRILGQADIFVGEVRQIEVTGALPTTGIALEDDGVKTTLSRMTPRFGILPLLPKLFSLSAGAANAAINVFFVADIEMPPGVQGDIQALTGGTPVPWGMHGLSSSGIVVAADMMVDAGDAKRLGRTLAHELGHALGLFHPTEVNGRVLEPLDDTPVCPATQDTAGDGLDAVDCADHGGDNLMFPTTAITATNLTEAQRTVLRRALILQ